MPKPFHAFKSKKHFNSKHSRSHNHDANESLNDESFGSEAKVKLGVISEELLSYYRNVSQSLNNDFEDSDSKDQFLNNVYASLKEDGIQVSQNQTVSRILEVLFAHSQPYHMTELFMSLSRELNIVTFDRFASHVFQALIKYLPAMYEVNDGSTTSPLKKSVEQICTYMESHMIDIMTHTYGSHVLRAFLQAVGGVEVQEEVLRSRMSRTQKKDDIVSQVSFSGKALSEDFRSSFVKLKDKVKKLCNFEDHLKDVNYCPVLQTVLLILHKTSPSEYYQLSKSIIEKTCIMPDSEDVNANDVSKKLPHIVQNEIGSFLIELLISLASETQFKEIYNLVFKDKLIYFAVHPVAGFVLRTLLSSVSDKSLMEEIMRTLLQYTEDILAVNHMGIIIKMAECCCRTGHLQNEFLKALMMAFHCYEPELRQIKIVPLLASLQTYDIFFSSDSGNTGSSEPSGHLLKSVNIHGSLFLQQLLQFKNTKLVVSSLMGLSPAEVAALCADKYGSHLIDTFFQSKAVPDKQKNAFIKYLQGNYVNIACNRNGSRCLENIWKSCSLKQRETIADELCQKQERVESDNFGRFLYRNFALFKFSHRKQEWLEIQGASLKKQRLLDEVLKGTDTKPALKGEGKQPKKKLKTHQIANESVTEPDSKEQFSPVTLCTTAEEETQPTVASDSSQHNKRKRKHEKKRVIRKPELDESIPLQEKVKEEKKKKKKKRKTDVDNETEAIPDTPDTEKSEHLKKKKHKKK
ncbi:nucleolar protein 9 [Biomphalaria glabrata]|nr:nucleolar protein 9-like [Biomphalaria glabrata]